MTDSSKLKSYKLPESAHPIAQKIYREILTLAGERSEMMMNYMRDAAALEAKYAPQSADLIERINAVKLKGSEEICNAMGLTYDPNSGYSIDTSYLDQHGVAFLQVFEREEGQRFDGKPGDMAPPGTRLN